MTTTLDNPTKKGLQLAAPFLPGDEQVLTTGALDFITSLHREFAARRFLLLEARRKRQKQLDQGKLPDFLPETTFIRDGEWTVAPIPAVLQDRRVEITGPVDRKMIINALNSGAKVFMADFEDSTSPTWRNVLEGQANLMDAVRGTIRYESEEGKSYTLGATPALLKVRPRGWHLEEKHLLIDGQPASASLVDVGLFVYHNGGLLATQQKGPFFYLPKLESHLEARLWDDVFLFAERSLGIARGTIKATVLIETLLAAFEMEEIIYELREHMAGLNAGRWDYIFSFIKKLRNHKNFVMPERASVTMTVPFMNAYAQLIVKTCHKRGVHAIGGMSAFIPSKDEAVNKVAYEKISADKIREASMGYDGTWVAHPKLVSVAQHEFDKVLGKAPHQKDKLCKDVSVTARQLLNVSSAGTKITEQGIRTNINVALLYLESWLRGIGAAALHNLMEDAATAEISRAQLWQWLNHEGVFLEDGRAFSLELYLRMEEEEMNALLEQFRREKRDVTYLNKAEGLLDKLVLSDDFEEFLTTLAYQQI
jgi:malate synthase